ncbi:hypothetical protein Taro_000452, partial [Colocasia esculenta]|nr:hypothetical protein [Colocasia esculenta]
NHIEINVEEGQNSSLFCPEELGGSLWPLTQGQRHGRWTPIMIWASMDLAVESGLCRNTDPSFETWGSVKTSLGSPKKVAERPPRSPSSGFLDVLHSKGSMGKLSPLLQLPPCRGRWPDQPPGVGFLGAKQQTNKNSHTTCQGILLRTKRARAEGVLATWRGRAADVLSTFPPPLEGQGEGEGARASERGREAGDPLPALLLPWAGRGGTRRERGEHVRLPRRGREAGRERAHGLWSSAHSALYFFLGRGRTRRAWDEARESGLRGGTRPAGEGARPAIFCTRLLLPRARRDVARVGRGEGVRAAWGREAGGRGRTAGNLLPLFASSADRVERGGERRGQGGYRLLSSSVARAGQIGGVL